jgi:ATP-dependent DNA helicase PIF1
MSTTELSLEQAYAFRKFCRRENLFISGPGGCGKTHLIHHMTRYMDMNGIKYQVCALTGCAAILLGKNARTLHSWAGMGLAAGPKDAVFRKMVANKKTVGEIKKVRVLIVDEVSMMSKKLMDLLDRALKHIKKVERPFGGIQVVFTGDFFQLPPVGSMNEEESCMFAFESAVWSQTFTLENHILLKRIFRQTDDEYKGILNQIRCGELDEASISTLMKCVKRPIGDITPTKLFALRSKTDFVNTRMYDKIEGGEEIYTIETKTDLKTYVETGKIIEPKYISLCLTLSEKEKEDLVQKMTEGQPAELRLKRGARVMCLQNIAIDQGVCNGSQGVVVDFVDSANRSAKMPLVLFSNGIRMVIEPVCKQVEEYPCIGVSQVPLCLAWALTIHKIQGATLSMAEMDLGDSIFEYGQTYVALSRIQSLDGLYLSAFKPSKIKANPTVKAFYNTIPEVPVEENPFRAFAYSAPELEEETYEKGSDGSAAAAAADIKVIRL